jgi:glycosyltransferase involved in cell wall biosynthesis
MGEKVRVLFYLFFPSGAIGKYTHQLLGELAQYDLAIEVVCQPEFQWRENEYYATWPQLFSINHRIPALRKTRFLIGQFVNPQRLLQRAKTFQADIVHFCNINHLSFPFWERYLDNSRIKVVCSAHDVRRRSKIISRLWEVYQLKRFYRRCDGLFVHGAGQAEELHQFTGVPLEKIHVVPHGLHTYAPPPKVGRLELRSKYGIPRGRLVALFFGFMRPDKNLDGFIRAMAMAQSDFHLVVAGDVGNHTIALLEKCKRLSVELGLQSRMTFLHRFIPDDEVPKLFAMCDWVALPYQQVFSSQSGVLNTAVYYQRPLLATPSPCFVETLNTVDIGVLCNGFEVADIAQGIDAINARLRDGYKHEFTRYREVYSWARNAALTWQVYQRLVTST